ncbi:MAG: hypothetical protein ACRCS9_15945, partial [Hyphomicrobium sp.]
MILHRQNDIPALVRDFRDTRDLFFEPGPEAWIDGIVDCERLATSRQRRIFKVLAISDGLPLLQIGNHLRQENRHILDEKQNLIEDIEIVVCDSRSWIDKACGPRIEAAAIGVMVFQIDVPTCLSRLKLSKDCLRILTLRWSLQISPTPLILSHQHAVIKRAVSIFLLFLRPLYFVVCMTPIAIAASAFMAIAREALHTSEGFTQDFSVKLNCRAPRTIISQSVCIVEGRTVAEAPKKAPRRTGQPLSNMEKAAALLLCMDKPLVNRIVKHFDEAEVQIVAQAAARLGSLPQPYVDELIDEFATAIAAGHDIQGTPQTAAQLLDGVVASEQLTDIMSDIAGNASSRVWSSLAAVPDTALVQYLSKQHPQIVTYILSRLTGSLVATVLEQLPVALRVQIMRRMLTLKEIAPVPLRFLEINLQLDLVSKAARNSAP